MQPTATSPAIQRWTVLALLEWSTNRLAELRFDEARLHVELLLAHVLGCSRLQLYTNFDRPLSADELARFRALFTRRLTHEPLQYILGETSFMGVPLAVDTRVLIPRPETELLVEKTIAAITSIPKTRCRVLDIGTGSGNIPIALAKFTEKIEIVSLDVSEDALAVARTNAERNNVRGITFLHGDIFSEILSDQIFDIVVSNPPYISAEEFATLQPEVKDFEPRLATTDGADGFRFIRRISAFAQQHLAAGGFLLMELAYNQSRQARQIVEDAGLHSIEIFADDAGHPRIIAARK